MLRLDRLWNHVKAFFGGYFWLPCPICGECFGGNEEGKGTLMVGYYEGELTCPRCAEEAERRNERFYRKV